MIDPNDIVKYDYTDEQLEELLIFSICCRQMKSSIVAPKVDSACGRGDHTRDHTPFERLRRVHNEGDGILALLLDIGGFRFPQQYADAIVGVITSGLDLRTCTITDLKKIKWLGDKTSRFFISSSRPDTKYAILDTHILKFLRDSGVPNVPKSTPSGKRYLDLQESYAKMVPEGKSFAEFDLEIWRKYSG